MILKKIKAHHLFLIVTILILIIGLYNAKDSDSTLDISVHDTYFVISNYHSTLALFIVYFFTGIIYWLFENKTQKRLVKWLTFIHSVILIGSFIIYWIVVLFSKLFITNDPFPFFDNQLINATLVTEFIIILFVAIPAFLVNVLIGLFRKV